MVTPKILVAIPTLNEAAHIERVLRDLHRGLPADADTVFVVCDGGSQDDTVAIVKRLRSEMTSLHLLHNPRRLQSAAVNLAVERFGSFADVLIRCDAHAGYPEAYVARLAATLDRTGADAVVVPMDSVGEHGLQPVVGWVSDCFIGSGGSAHRAGRRSGFVDHGHHAAFRMASFRRAGGYDETYSHNEDAELDCRQRTFGSRIYLDASIRVAYYPRDSLSSLWRQYFKYGRGRSRTIRRHPDSWRLRQLAVPVHTAMLISSLPLAALISWALLWPVIYGLILASVSAGLAVRYRDWRGLLAAPVAAAIHTGWGLGFLHGLLTLDEAPWRQTAPRPSRVSSQVSKTRA